ncbi:MAG: MFS transporter [Neisseriales bacterium]|nr:MAG: MFS transporter [Neisseriales bacterium]
MDTQKIRLGLYAERLTLALAYGQFFMLPLYFKSLGLNEEFFGQVYAVGAVGTVLSVSSTASMIRKFGLNRIAPLGGLVYFLGCMTFFIASITHSIFGYYLASLINGIGWGLAFTIGPICIGMTATNENRIYHFSIYATFTTIGVGLAPVLADCLTKYGNFGHASMFVVAILFSALAFLFSYIVSKHNQLYQNMPIRQMSWLMEFKEVMKTPSVYFFAMGAFGACILTTILYLQTTFAAAKGIDHKIFYIFYTLSVASSRILLSRSLSHFAPQKTITYLVLLMLAGIGLLFFAEAEVVCYVGAALLFGAGYGLLFPIIQAQSANYAPIHLQASVIVYFTLCFFIANYCFPYVGAFIAVHYSYDALLWVLILAGLAELVTALYFYRFIQNKTN